MTTIDQAIEQNPNITIGQYCKDYLNKPFEVKTKATYGHLVLRHKINRMTALQAQKLIIETVCRLSGLKFEELNTDIRTNKLIEARFCIMWFVRKYTKTSWVSVGEIFKGRNGTGYDHSTAIHAVDKWEIYKESGACKTFHENVLSELNK